MDCEQGSGGGNSGRRNKISEVQCVQRHQLAHWIHWGEWNYETSKVGWECTYRETGGQFCRPFLETECWSSSNFYIMASNFANPLTQFIRLQSWWDSHKPKLQETDESSKQQLLKSWIFHSSHPKRSLGLSYLKSLCCPRHLDFYIQLSPNPTGSALWNFLQSIYSSHFHCHHLSPKYHHLLPGKPAS